jgi:hypothetical protein
MVTGSIDRAELHWSHYLRSVFEIEFDRQRERDAYPRALSSRDSFAAAAPSRGAGPPTQMDPAISAAGAPTKAWTAADAPREAPAQFPIGKRADFVVKVVCWLGEDCD